MFSRAVLCRGWIGICALFVFLTLTISLSIFVFSSHIPTVRATGNTYYFRADGTAANLAASTGPASDPTKCMNVALFNSTSTFAAGDIIYASSQGSTFAAQVNLHSTSVGTPITLEAVPGESPLFNVGSGAAYSITLSGRANWDFRGLHVAGGTSANINISSAQNGRFYNTVSEGGVQIFNMGTSSGTVIDGVTNTGNITGSYAILAAGATGSATWKNITLSDLSVTTAALWWASTTASSTLTADHITLTNIVGGGLIIRPVNSGGIDIDNFTATNVGSAGSYKYGIMIDGQTALTDLAVTMDNTIIDTTGSYGLYIRKFTSRAGSYIRDTTVSSAGNLSIYMVRVDGLLVDIADITGGIDLLFLDTVTNSTFQDVIGRRSQRDGISLTTSSNNTFTRCRVSEVGQIDVDSNGDGFTAHAGCLNNVFNYCVSDNNRNTGFAMVNTSTGTINNATIYKNGDPTSEYMGERGGFFDDGTQGWTIQNSLFSENYPYEVNIKGAVAAASSFNYNNYYNPTISTPFNFMDTVGAIDWTAYHASYEANSVYGDPKLVSATDFHLLSTSPAIDAGIDVGLTTDFVNKKIYDNPATINTGSIGLYSKTYVDMGAYEYVIPPVPTLISPSHPLQTGYYASSTTNVDVSVSPSSTTTTYRYTIDQTLAPDISIVLAGTASATATLSIADDIITSEGLWYVHAVAYNLDGDVSPTYGTFMIKYDHTIPEDFTPTATSGWINANAVDITFSANDTLSGIASYLVKLDSGAYSGSVISPYSLDVTAASDGEHTVTVKAIDDAGNYLEKTTMVNLDKTAPVDFTPTANPSSYTTGNVTLTFATTDALSGLTDYKYKIGSGSYSSAIVSPYLLDTSALGSGDYIVMVKATDNANNIREHSVLVYIDKTAPAIDAGANKSIHIGGLVKLSGTVTGQTSITWSANSSAVSFVANERTATPTVTCDILGTYILTMTATDALGNTSSDAMTLTVRRNGDINDIGTISGGASDAADLFAAGSTVTPSVAVGKPAVETTAPIITSRWYTNVWVQIVFGLALVVILSALYLWKKKH